MTPSPCNKVCVLDPATGFCIGCGRSGEEIGAWLGMTEAQRAALVVILPERLRRMASRDGRSEEHAACRPPR